MIKAILNMGSIGKISDLNTILNSSIITMNTNNQKFTNTVEFVQHLSSSIISDTVPLHGRLQKYDSSGHFVV